MNKQRHKAHARPSGNFQPSAGRTGKCPTQLPRRLGPGSRDRWPEGAGAGPSAPATSSDPACGAGPSSAPQSVTGCSRPEPRSRAPPAPAPRTCCPLQRPGCGAASAAGPASLSCLRRASRGLGSAPVPELRHRPLPGPAPPRGGAERPPARPLPAATAMAVPVAAEAGGGRQRALAAGSPVDYMSITSFPRLPEEDAGGAAESGLRARKEEDAFLGEQDTGEGRRPSPPAAQHVPGPAEPRSARGPGTPGQGSPQPAAPSPSRPAPGAAGSPGPRGERGPPGSSPSPAPRLPCGAAGMGGAGGAGGWHGASDPFRQQRGVIKSGGPLILEKTLCLFLIDCFLLSSSEKRFFSLMPCFSRNVALHPRGCFISREQASALPTPKPRV